MISGTVIYIFVKMTLIIVFANWLKNSDDHDSSILPNIIYICQWKLYIRNFDTKIKKNSLTITISCVSRLQIPFVQPVCFSRLIPLLVNEKKEKGVMFHGKIVDIAEALNVTRSPQAIIDITLVCI